MIHTSPFEAAFLPPPAEAGVFCGDFDEKRRKEKNLLDQIKVPPVIKREEILPGVKLMKEREINPARMYSTMSLQYQRKYGGHF